MVKTVTVLVSTISNTQIFLLKNVSSFCKCKSYSHFFSKQKKKKTYMPYLTNCNLETPKRVINKQYRPRSDAADSAASDQGLHCLQIVQPFFSRNILII